MIRGGQSRQAEGTVLTLKAEMNLVAGVGVHAVVFKVAS